MRARVLVLVLVSIASLVFAATASATTRYAATDGDDGTDCTVKTEPCTLGGALEVMAEEGDTVIIEAGTYSLPNSGVEAQVEKLKIQGDPAGSMPKLVFSPPPGKFVPAFRGAAGAEISYLEVENTDPESFAIQCGNDERLERVRAVNLQGGVAIQAGGGCEIADSLAVSSGEGATAIGAFTIFGDPVVPDTVITDSTAVAYGKGSVGIRGFSLEGEGSYEVLVTNTVASGASSDLETNQEMSTAPISIQVDHSNFHTATAMPSTSIVEGAGNQTASPLFVDAAAGDYREAPGSPTIEAGVALPNPPALDLAGAARVQGASIDIGAFETSNPPPPNPPNPPTPPPSSETIAPMQPTPTVAPPAPAPAPAPAPIVSALKLAPNSFRAANLGGSTAFTFATTAKAAVGSTAFYTLNTPATVVFTVALKATGRKAGAKCVAKSKGNEDKPKCQLLKPVKGTFSLPGTAAINSFKFTGRVGGKDLKPGAYRLIATAGASTASAGFRIVE